MNECLPLFFFQGRHHKQKRTFYVLESSYAVFCFSVVTIIATPISTIMMCGVAKIQWAMNCVGGVPSEMLLPWNMNQRNIAGSCISNKKPRRMILNKLVISPLLIPKKIIQPPKIVAMNPQFAISASVGP